MGSVTGSAGELLAGPAAAKASSGRSKYPAETQPTSFFLSPELLTDHCFSSGKLTVSLPSKLT